MSLQAVANHMASQGRGPDSMLVHMAPGEVKGLQALAMAHGGSLTINPQTGLPEAGFLSSILPMVAGAFLGPAGMGLFGSAATAGLGVGALTGLATGSLKKGLMAGLGAYGGAGLASSVMGAGGAAGQTVPMAGENMSISIPGLNAAPVAPTGVAAAVPNVTALPPSAVAAPTANVSPEVQNLLSRFPAPMATPVPPVQTAVSSPTTAMPASTPQMGKFDQFRSGIDVLMKDPKQFLNKENMKYGLAALAPMMMASEDGGKPVSDSQQTGFSYSPGRQDVDYGGPYTGERTYFRPSYTRLAADGGTMSSEYDYVYDPATQLYKRKEEEAATPKTPSMSPFADMGPSAPMNTVQGDPSHPLYGIMTPMANAIASGVNSISGFFGGQPVISAGGHSYVAGGDYLGSSQGGASSGYEYGYDPSNPTGDYGGDAGVGVAAGPGGESVDIAQGGLTALAGGGISHLGDYSDGGRLLRGPGDGVSDDIPATIANKRPARLADGEFVVPARIVSELGNGSTEAGARKLYAMMDRVQKNRAKTVGKGRVAVNSRSDKLLPA